MAGLALVGAAQASALDSRFATGVASYGGLGASPLYGDPRAALGPPSTWIRDDWHGGPDLRVAVSLAYGAWNVSPDGAPVVVTIPSGGWVTLQFDPPIADSPSNWRGMDFIVYGNSFLVGAPASWNTNMDALRIGSGAVFSEPVTVAVSPDGLSWHTYAAPHADGFWPTQAFSWTDGAWGEPQDPGKPVPPTLTAASVAGRTVAQAIRMFRGSAGGTAFDLAPSGFAAVRYMRLTSNGGEVDSVARVGPAGDANGDGRVDLADFLRFAAAYDTAAGDAAFDLRCDFDDDDRVDLADFLILAANYED
jgi:hypothetical protein